MDVAEHILVHQSAEALEEIIRSAIGAHMRSMWTAMPVSLQEDSDGKTVKVRFSVKSLERSGDGKLNHVELPDMPEMPINFAAGGGMTNTIPLKKGDEGLVVFASRAVAAWRQSGGVQQAIDGRSHHLADGFFIPGVKPMPKDLKDINTEAVEQRSDDGKNRTIHHPKHGTKVSNNDGKQVLDVNATSGAIEATGKTVMLKAGEASPGAAPNVANVTDRDLNEQLKGLSARVAQVEKVSHALFDVTSRLREIAQARVPELATLAPLLNQQPVGLDAIVGAIEGKAMAYLQAQVKQALGMFSNPTIAGVASLIGGSAEAQIGALSRQMMALTAANPVVSQVEGLQRQADAILARGASAVTTEEQLRPILSQIASLTAANPVVGEVQGIAAQIKGLAAQAGSALSFLEPQQRLAKGQLKSVLLTEG